MIMYGEKFIQFVHEYLLVPVAYAADDKITILLGRINRYIINPLILILFAMAFFWFFLGLLKFFQMKEKGGDELDQAKRHVVWGIVGMAIMVSVFGIMNLLTGTIGLGDISSSVQKGGGGAGDVSVLFKS